ncbi:MAG: carboxypeptidase regulatory-like domain-containing protein [Chitinophagaceae bacterium]|nr:carboxypeptidase regulatory-like domain-containing protein [Chitinophagaceae bacterium]
MKNQSLYRNISFLFLLISSIFLFNACQREIEGGGAPTPTPTPPGPVVNDAIMVTGGVNGIVVDENNQPVAGVTVSSGAASTTTDRYGAFKFRNISLSKANATVKVIKSGYFNAYRSFPATAGVINNVRIKLIPKTNSGSFTASTGGTISIAGGGKLVMPANAITDAGGTAFSGTVNVAMAWIDPSSADLPFTLMGDLRGITTGGEERGLSTYGMLGVELTGPGAVPMKVAAGKTAELTFPIPASLLSSAPATIDLWHFDEATARWKQEGTATKSGSFYIAQVSHFSFWNCERVVNNAYGYGRTDSLGNLCGKVPKDEALVLEVLDICNNVIYTQNIGPFSAAATLPPVTVNIPAANNLIITGTVTNCANANVTNGAAAIYVTGGNHYVVPVNNGTFSLSLIRCGSNPINFTVLGIDYAAFQQSAPVGGSGITGTVNVGTLQACGTSSLQFIEILVDGNPINLASPPDNISTIDTTLPSGPYSSTTRIAGYRQSAGSLVGGDFTFLNNGVAANNLPLQSVTVFAGSGVSSQMIITPNPVVNITTFGPPVTGFIEGSFNIQMDFSGTPRNVTFNFRVRR